MLWYSGRPRPANCKTFKVPTDLIANNCFLHFKVMEHLKVTSGNFLRKRTVANGAFDACIDLSGCGGVDARKFHRLLGVKLCSKEDFEHTFYSEFEIFFHGFVGSCHETFLQNSGTRFWSIYPAACGKSNNELPAILTLPTGHALHFKFFFFSRCLNNPDQLKREPTDSSLTGLTNPVNGWPLQTLEKLKGVKTNTENTQRPNKINFLAQITRNKNHRD